MEEQKKIAAGSEEQPIDNKNHVKQLENHKKEVKEEFKHTQPGLSVPSTNNENNDDTKLSLSVNDKSEPDTLEIKNCLQTDKKVGDFDEKCDVSEKLSDDKATNLSIGEDDRCSNL